MSVLDKLMFWKKKDDFSDLGLDKPGGDPFGNPGSDPFAGPDPGLGTQKDSLGMDSFNASMPQTGSPSMPQNNNRMNSPDPFGNDMSSDPMQPRFTQQQSSFNNPNPQQELENKNMEIISSKLDTIRASIESLSQRLANIEAIARNEEEAERRRRGRYY